VTNSDSSRELIRKIEAVTINFSFEKSIPESGDRGSVLMINSVLFISTSGFVNRKPGFGVRTGVPAKSLYLKL